MCAGYSSYVRTCLLLLLLLLLFVLTLTHHHNTMQSVVDLVEHTRWQFSSVQFSPVQCSSAAPLDVRVL